MNFDKTPLVGKSVLITGGTGFIGSHLRRSIFGSTYSCYSPTHQELAINQFMPPKVDYIIHAAGYAAPAIFTKQTIETIQVNTDTLHHLVDRLNPSGSILFCSTSEIYKGIDHLATEDDIGTTTPQHERSAYIEGKRCGEAIIHAYRERGIRAMSARISLAYGPGTKKSDARVLNQFIEKAFTKGRIDLIDDGSARPTYCYIDDTVEMLWNILLHGTQEVYNVGGVSEISLSALSQKIGHMLGVPAVIPVSPVGIPHVKMDISRYQKEFGKTDYVSLDDGLRATIAYQKALYDPRAASGNS